MPLFRGRRSSQSLNNDAASLAQASSHDEHDELRQPHQLLLLRPDVLPTDTSSFSNTEGKREPSIHVNVIFISRTLCTVLGMDMAQSHQICAEMVKDGVAVAGTWESKMECEEMRSKLEKKGIKCQTVAAPAQADQEEQDGEADDEAASVETEAVESKGEAVVEEVLEGSKAEVEADYSGEVPSVIAPASPPASEPASPSASPGETNNVNNNSVSNNSTSNINPQIQALFDQGVISREEYEQMIQADQKFAQTQDDSVTGLDAASNSKSSGSTNKTRDKSRPPAAAQGKKDKAAVATQAKPPPATQQKKDKVPDLYDAYGHRHHPGYWTDPVAFQQNLLILDDLCLVEFCRKFNVPRKGRYAGKIKYHKNGYLTGELTFSPVYSSDTDGPDYGKYCRFALVQYRPWVGTPFETDEKGVERRPDEKQCIKEWRRFLKALAERRHIIPDLLLPIELRGDGDVDFGESDDEEKKEKNDEGRDEKKVGAIEEEQESQEETTRDAVVSDAADIVEAEVDEEMGGKDYATEDGADTAENVADTVEAVADEAVDGAADEADRAENEVDTKEAVTDEAMDEVDTNESSGVLSTSCKAEVECVSQQSIDIDDGETYESRDFETKEVVEGDGSDHAAERNESTDDDGSKEAVESNATEIYDDKDDKGSDAAPPMEVAEVDGTDQAVEEDESKDAALVVETTSSSPDNGASEEKDVGSPTSIANYSDSATHDTANDATAEVQPRRLDEAFKAEEREEEKEESDQGEESDDDIYRKQIGSILANDEDETITDRAKAIEDMLDFMAPSFEDVTLEAGSDGSVGHEYPMVDDEEPAKESKDSNSEKDQEDSESDDDSHSFEFEIDLEKSLLDDFSNDDKDVDDDDDDDDDDEGDNTHGANVDAKSSADAHDSDAKPSAKDMLKRYGDKSKTAPVRKSILSGVTRKFSSPPKKPKKKKEKAAQETKPKSGKRRSIIKFGRRSVNTGNNNNPSSASSAQVASAVESEHDSFASADDKVGIDLWGDEESEEVAKDEDEELLEI